MPGNPFEGRMETMVELYSPSLGVVSLSHLKAMWEKQRTDWIGKSDNRQTPCLIEEVAERYADEIFDSKSSKKPVPLRLIIETLQEIWEDDDEIDLSLSQGLRIGADDLLKEEP